MIGEWICGEWIGNVERIRVYVANFLFEVPVLQANILIEWF